MFVYRYEIIENIINKNDVVSKKDKSEIAKANTEEDLKKLNQTIGKNIRNFYSLWNMNNPNIFEYGTQKMLIHPNDFTLEVLKEIKEKLNEKEQDV
jgi:hypothetical protein